MAAGDPLATSGLSAVGAELPNGCRCFIDHRRAAVRLQQPLVIEWNSQMEKAMVPDGWDERVSWTGERAYGARNWQTLHGN